MKTFLTELRQTIAPSGETTYGPLPPMLLALTVVTGLVDACSYLVLGHVFVANMTGNVVFLAFALAGAHGFSIPASIVALGSFGLGALIGGRVGSTLAHHRGRHLSASTIIQALFLAVAVILAAWSTTPVTEEFRYGLIVALGLAMGTQNAAARKLAVPDMTTTVLTMTITGIGADGPVAGKSGARLGRRGLTIVAMFAGAIVGAVLVVHTHTVYALAIALVIAATVAVSARVLGASDPAWTRAGS